MGCMYVVCAIFIVRRCREPKLVAAAPARHSGNEITYYWHVLPTSLSSMPRHVIGLACIMLARCLPPASILYDSLPPTQLARLSIPPSLARNYSLFFLFSLLLSSHTIMASSAMMEGPSSIGFDFTNHGRNQFLGARLGGLPKGQLPFLRNQSPELS